ncbi:MAG: Uncharacterised protein [Cryomorphaceae bacterium]|nr:MAG: Uncharacterised protein [Cryomorphaceae bacterium]
MKKLLLLSALLIFGCSGEQADDSTSPVDIITPSNLILEVSIQGVSESYPNGDGSGNVIFNSTADNTDYFEYRFDSGEVILSESGYLEFTFLDYGTSNKSIDVYAFNDNGNSTFISDTITIYVENPNAVYTLELDFSDEFPVGHNLGLNYYNDITVGVLDYSENYIKLLTASGTSSYVLEGESLDNLSSVIQVASPVDNTYYSNYVGLGQIIKDDNGTIYSVFHSEQHDGTQCPGNVPGFYASVGMATSYDNGQSFQLSNTALLENTYNINYDNGQCDGGLGEPSITFSKDSTEVFVYYVDHNRDGRGVNICMSKFNVNSNKVPDFDNPYYLDSNNNFTNEVIRSKEVVVGEGDSDAIFPHVTYNSFSDSYIMVYSENNWGEFINGAASPSASGIYYRQSEDGINWDSPASQLITDWAIPWSFDSHSFSWHPNLIYNNENQTEGYLIYSKANSLEEGHKMWAVKFNIVAN